MTDRLHNPIPQIRRIELGTSFTATAERTNLHNKTLIMLISYNNNGQNEEHSVKSHRS